MIRLAKFEDLDSVVEIYNHAIDAGFQTAFTTRFNPGERRAWLMEHIDTEYPLFVYEKDGKVAGFLYLSPYREGRPALRYSIEISYFIHKDYRSKGIATALMGYALPACRGLNYKNALAILMETNVASIRLLEKFGFQQWGYLPGVADFGGVECGQYFYGKRL